MAELAGKVAIVTGASRGIGAAAAFVLAKAGAAVMLAARDGTRTSRLAEEIVAGGGRATAVACDVADYGSVQTMVEETSQRLGNIDILVNNAGVIEPISSLVQSDPAAWGRIIEINLLGAYHAARATLPRMLEAGKWYSDQHFLRCRASPARRLERLLCRRGRARHAHQGHRARVRRRRGAGLRLVAWRY
jgi:3-oxoacyl-[acyl-carrier protein] reductase